MNVDNNLEESIENKYVLYNKAKKNLSLTIEESIYILKRKYFRDDLENIAVEMILNELKMKDDQIDFIKNEYENTIEEKDKIISNLKYALMDMTLQFADEDGEYINTMGLSALETAFNELNFDEPMKISEVHKQYKKLAKEYFEKKVEG